jgi:hypothetical protein
MDAFMKLMCFSVLVFFTPSVLDNCGALHLPKALTTWIRKHAYRAIIGILQDALFLRGRAAGTCLPVVSIPNRDIGCQALDATEPAYNPTFQQSSNEEDSAFNELPPQRPNVTTSTCTEG